MKDFFKNLGTGKKIILGVVALAIVVTIIYYTGVDIAVRPLND